MTLFTSSVGWRESELRGGIVFSVQIAFIGSFSLRLIHYFKPNTHVMWSLAAVVRFTCFAQFNESSAYGIRLYDRVQTMKNELDERDIGHKYGTLVTYSKSLRVTKFVSKPIKLIGKWQLQGTDRSIDLASPPQHCFYFQISPAHSMTVEGERFAYRIRGLVMRHENPMADKFPFPKVIDWIGKRRCATGARSTFDRAAGPSSI